VTKVRRIVLKTRYLRTQRVRSARARPRSQALNALSAWTMPALACATVFSTTLPHLSLIFSKETEYSFLNDIMEAEIQINEVNERKAGTSEATFNVAKRIPEGFPK